MNDNIALLCRPEGEKAVVRIKPDLGTHEKIGRQWLRVTDNGVCMISE